MQRASFCLRRLFSTDSDWKTLLGYRSAQRSSSVVHIKRQRVEQGEYVQGSDALRALLGHDIKERAVEPDPRSDRWRTSFLRVGAFRRRSVRVEVRKREFGPDEYLHLAEPSVQTAVETVADNAAALNGIPLDDFAAYVDARLAEMETRTTSPESTLQPSLGEMEDRAVEFRTLPFRHVAEIRCARKVYRVGWMPSDYGTRRRQGNRFRWGVWWLDWAHMWSSRLRFGARLVPSSLRRFYNPSNGETLPRQAQLYVEDAVRGDRELETALVVEFLETQPSFRGVGDVGSYPRNTFWPKRRQGEARWTFLRDLSESIRQERFRFEWEQREPNAKRIYTWRRRVRAGFVQKKSLSGVPVGGRHAPLKERFHAQIRNATFRMHPASDDSDTDS